MHGVPDMWVQNGLESQTDGMATVLNETTRIERSICGSHRSPQSPAGHRSSSTREARSEASGVNGL